MKRTPLKRKTPMKRSAFVVKKRTLKSFAQLPRTSAKREREKEIYDRLRIEFLREHPFCEVRTLQNGQYADCRCYSDQVHHTRGRGKFFLDVSTFLAVCDPCHKRIHRNVAWARERGFLVYGKDGK